MKPREGGVGNGYSVVKISILISCVLYGSCVYVKDVEEDLDFDTLLEKEMFLPRETSRQRRYGESYNKNLMSYIEDEGFIPNAEKELIRNKRQIDDVGGSGDGEEPGLAFQRDFFTADSPPTDLFGDDNTALVNVNLGVAFGSSLFNRIYVGTNGIISFGQRYNSFSPSANVGNRDFLAAYWADINRNDGGTIKYQVIDADFASNARDPLIDISSEVKFHMKRTDFRGTWAMIVTYDAVPPYSSSNEFQTITFQVVVVSDGTDTYAILLYKYNQMRWQSGNILIGFTEDRRFSGIVYSGTTATYQIDKYLGNTGQYGYWIFKIGSAANSAQSCFNWYLRQDSTDVLNSRFNRLPFCPCRYLSFDWRWRVISIRSSYFCTTLRSPFFLQSRECCYSNERRSLISSIPQRGSSWLYHPRFYSRLHYEEDELPKQWCCGTSRALCQLYYFVRPNNFCSNFFPFFWAFFFGDPHIVTLDGKNYVFNGHGEYVLFDLKSGTDTIMIQGRTAPAETSNGTLSNATIFTAFAAQDSNGADFQVELNSNKSGLIVYGKDFIDLTNQFYSDPNYVYTDIVGKLTITRNGSSLSAEFAQGITMNVGVGVKLLTISLSVPTTFKNSTTGLLGNFNGDPDDDFIKRDGSILSSNLTEREIFYFGQEWQISSSESVFKYSPRKGVDDFAHPEFVPLFLDEQPQSVRDEAISVCGGAENLACVYDFVATGSQEVAQATRTSNAESEAIDSEIANSSPDINGTEVINATVNEPVSMTVQGFDAEDGTNVDYNIVNQPGYNFTFDNVTGQASWTPGNTNPVEIAFSVADTRGAESSQLDVEIRLCDGCSGHGTCDHATLRQQSSGEMVSTFQLVECICDLGWSGESCSEDFDACSNDPCLIGQNCTDLEPTAHDNTNNGYNCTACPQGYEGDVSIGKCNDINECNTTNECDQTCNNIEGGYTCSCKSGFRKSGIGKCNDINECDELLHDCEHFCENSVGSYNCSCRSGYTLNSDSKTCQIDDATLCNNSGCQDGCEVKDGTPSCFCNSGYVLEGNQTCIDEDECKRNPTPCSQICNNTVGSFSCSCHPGFTLDADKITCKDCEFGSYGTNCESTCSCSEHATTCDKVRGCVCKSGWRGGNCTIDIEECDEQTFTCPDTTICSNTPGSYQCNCQNGYEKKDGLCVDIDECADLSLQNCGDNTLCENTNGSFVCKCNSGYIRDTSTACKDFDECSTNSHGCDQTCVNFEGTYNCECEYGFELADDRQACVKVEDVCAKFENLNCSYACNVSLTGESANCYCQNGYRLLNDKQTCQDINECDGENECSHTCVNRLGSYSCSCPIGKKLENDGRRCSDCDDSHWGENCVNECSCGIGSSECNKEKGCVCKDGWQGDKCDQDKDECAAVGVCPELSTCRNIPGNYVCDCRQGYEMAPNNTCIDINECSSTDLNNCDSICTNTVGSYDCSCFDGFVLKSGKCEDIDECATSKDNCEHNCRNEIGSFACECRNGYKVSDTDSSKCTRNSDANCTRTDCSQECEITDRSVEICFCLRGYELDADTVTCNDIDECTPNPCEDSCTQGAVGTYTCTCLNPGYKLDSDEISCRECSEGNYGVECNDTCTCTAANTISCNKTDGACNCRNGWEGDKCETDIDECDKGLLSCPSNSQCKNTNGSAICICSIGFFKSGDSCVECDDTHWGDQCKEDCTCNINNVQSCNKVDGRCTCKSTWNGTNCETDVDECVNTPNICGSAEYKCVNLNGSHRCDCSTGYQKNQDDACIDIDECTDTPCPTFEQCKNSVGSYNCICPTEGFKIEGGTCIDINECDTDKGGCQHNCTNNDGSFTCVCDEGYTLNIDSKTCDDINECDTDKGGCQHNCTNNNGSFACVCDEGYTLNIDSKTCDDINECDTDKGGCQHNCTNNDGSFICVCDEGYTLNIDTKTCDDINECDTNKGGCQHNCTNNDGSFICVCYEGYTLNIDTKTCDDINECDTDKGGCQHNCTNTDGSFICVCDEGYTLNIDTKTCDELTQCENNNGGCEQTCVNKNDGVGVVCSCYGGYYNDSDNKCKDIDECETLNGQCAQNCNNIDGSYYCDCRSGHKLNADNKTCDDVNECDNLDICNAKDNSKCKNTDGNYQCVCKEGFEEDGTVCKDIDECETLNGQCAHGCNNIDGSYFCDCRSGYKLNADNKTCDDINECVDSDICNTKDYSECENSAGGYQCVCKEGFEKDGTLCKDVDECTQKTDGCEQNCSNTIGLFQCFCNEGFALNDDNKTCSDLATVSMSITLADPDNTSTVLDNPNSEEYKEFEESIELSLYDLFKPNIEELLRVEVKSLEKGSIIAEYDLILRLTSGDRVESSLGVAETAKQLLDGEPLVIGNTSYELNDLTINNQTVSDLKLCELFEVANGKCPSGEECQVEGGKPVCKSTVSDAGLDLIIGLSVGIPLLFLLIALVTCIVCFKLNARNKKKDSLVSNNGQGNGNGSVNNFAFSSSLPKRSSHGAGMYLPYIPDGLSVASSSDSGTQQKKTKKRKGREDFRDSAWYDSQSFPHEAQPNSNFSWDYLYRMLQPDSKFEIRRPRVNASPRSGLTQVNRQSAA